MARRVLIEAAWSYHWPARRSVNFLARQKAAPAVVRDIGWKAQLRLTRRYRKLTAAGKLPKIAVAAVDR